MSNDNIIYDFNTTNESSVNKNTINYNVEITQVNPNECVHIDPMGLCTPTDCMTCRLSRVVITRDDGVVMRNDFSRDENAGYELNILSTEYDKRKEMEKCQDNPIYYLEKYCNVELPEYQKIILRKILHSKKKQKK